MNYYKRHLGDYAKDTKHLTLVEHGAFCVLLDYYYATEKPIPDGRCERIANAYADAERTAVRTVLREFFVETPEGWRNAKADEVIAEANAKSLKAKDSAKNRWMRTQCDGNANAMRTQCDGNASHKPLAINHKEQDQKQKQPPAKKPPAAQPVPDPPDWVAPEAWNGFVEMRRRQRFPLTARAAELIFAELEKLRAKGHAPVAVLDQSTRNAWRDVFPIRELARGSPKPSVAQQFSEKTYTGTPDDELPNFLRPAAN